MALLIPAVSANGGQTVPSEAQNWPVQDVLAFDHPVQPLPSERGLQHPLPGSLVSQGIHGDNGIDLSAKYGTPVLAVENGTVVRSVDSGWNGGYGQYVVVQHENGTQALYAHLSSNYVSIGAYVSRGDKVGGVGSTGRSTGNHLHFEFHGGDDPQAVVRQFME